MKGKSKITSEQKVIAVKDYLEGRKSIFKCNTRPWR